MKKKWLLFLIPVLVILGLVGGGLAYMHHHTLSFSTGMCMVSQNGSYLILLDDSPIVMRNCTGDDTLFDGLHSGDTIRILHDGIQESYPGGTGVYYCRVTENGTIADLPEDILESLSSMGWKVMDIDGTTREIYTGIVESYSAVYGDEGNFLLKLTVEDWETQTLTMTVVEASRIQAPDGIRPGDTVRVSCIAESSGYREVLSLTVQ